MKVEEFIMAPPKGVLGFSPLKYIEKISKFFYVPATKLGEVYNFTLSVCMYICTSLKLCSTVLVSATPPTVFDVGV